MYNSATWIIDEYGKLGTSQADIRDRVWVVFWRSKCPTKDDIYGQSSSGFDRDLLSIAWDKMETWSRSNGGKITISICCRNGGKYEGICCSRQRDISRQSARRCEGASLEIKRFNDEGGNYSFSTKNELKPFFIKPLFKTSSFVQNSPSGSKVRATKGVSFSLISPHNL